jgi:hypothetical protein
LDPNIVYGGGPYGDVTRYDHTTGQSQVISPSVLATFGTPAPLRKYRFTWTSPIVFDRRDPHLLYIGSQVLLATRDGGLHWKEISPDLTGADGSLRDKNGPPTIADASAKGWGVIYTVAPSPLQDGLIWVGTDDGLIQITEDGGKRWRNVTPPGLLPWSKISLIDASPFDPGTAYAAVDRHRLDDFAPYIYVTRDFGRHWIRAGKGIDSLAYVQVVRSDLTRRGLLYAGTETGVYVSFDEGENWQSLQLNLPVASVRDLAVHDNDLVAATHGRAFWVLDDLTPLQQLSTKVIDADVHLFKPERAIRMRRSENRDTPLPPEEPLGTNPPNGAIIDYYLRTKPQSRITLEITDGAGNLVRRYSSSDLPDPTSGPQYFMNDWLPKTKPLSMEAGHNRFVWDLRYSPPPTSQHDYSMAAIAGQGTERQPQGPLVLPGTYHVRLTVVGRTYSETIEVTMDPRVHTSENALKEQLSLAINVWNAMADQYALKTTLDSLSAQLAALQQRNTTDTLVRSSTQALSAKVDELRKPLNAGDLAALETAIIGADREPTEQMREAYAMLNGKHSSSKAMVQELNNGDITQLNKKLNMLGISTIRVPFSVALHLAN